MTTSIPNIPAEVTALTGHKQYWEKTGFEIHMSYVHNTCAAVHNGNPLYWDSEVAREITGGHIAPPTMLSVWFCPHYWSPGIEGEGTPLQLHFDMKERLGLPEAIIAGNELVFGEPVRMGDELTTHQVLRSISEAKTTQLGVGRFWVIDVVYENQHGAHVGTDTYTCLGYQGVAS